MTFAKKKKNRICYQQIHTKRNTKGCSETRKKLTPGGEVKE